MILRLILLIIFVPFISNGVIPEIFGFYPMLVEPKSDGYIGLPLEPQQEFAGKVEEVYGSNIRTNGVDIQLNKPSFLRVRTGPLTGYEFEVISIINDIIEINNENIDINILTGESISIIPYWSLNSIFKYTELYNGLQVLVREPHIGGINRAPSKVFTFYDGFWYNQVMVEQGDYPIKHYVGLTVRNIRDLPLAIQLIGRVSMTKKVIRLKLPMSFEGNDRFFTLGFPESIELQEIIDIPNLVSIMVYDTIGINPAPDKIFTFYNNNWYDQNLQYANNFELKPDQTYVIRFLPPHQEFTWVFEPFYLQNL